MIYPYDQITPLPVADLYDTQLMLMSIAAARDMYEKGQQLIKDFYKEYGDFMSPFAKDMERYNQIVGGVRDTVNNLYANGIDPLRSAEGRAMVAQIINSVNPAEMNAMRANAKMGYAYQDALQKLRSAGKYSQSQEDFDMALNGVTPFSEFSTSDGSGGFNSWNRPSPIQATTLRELTQDSYKGRTPRTLTKEDFANDPRLRGMAFDPRYEYTGYVDSDLMKVAPGASASLAADPRAAYFRDIARQKVIAMGLQPTEGNVEAQFQRDIADANAWALVDPVRKADDFAKMNQEYRYQSALQSQKHNNEMAQIREAAKYKGNGNNDDGTGGGFLKSLSLNAQGVRLGTLDSFIDQGALKSKISGLETSLKKKGGNVTEGDIVKTLQKAEEYKNAARKDGFRKWLFNNSIVGGNQSVFNTIMSLGDGQNGVTTVNSILEPFATNSDSENVGKDLLLHAGFKMDENGNYVMRDGENARIVTPHQILSNMIRFDSNNFKGKQKLLKALTDNADTRTNWNSAKTNQIAGRTTVVSPTSSNRGVIIAPNDRGIPTMYVKVKTISDSWFDGDHNGYWVEAPIPYGADNLPTSQSTTIFQASEEHEGKRLGNSQRKEAYDNQN